MVRFFFWLRAFMSYLKTFLWSQIRIRFPFFTGDRIRMRISQMEGSGSFFHKSATLPLTEDLHYIRHFSDLCENIKCISPLGFKSVFVSCVHRWEKGEKIKHRGPAPRPRKSFFFMICTTRPGESPLYALTNSL